jgi:hypothetical protein
VTDPPYRAAAENDVIMQVHAARSSSLNPTAPGSPPLATRLRHGLLKPVHGAVRPLAEAPAVFAPDKRTPAKTIHRVT